MKQVVSSKGIFGLNWVAVAEPKTRTLAQEYGSILQYTVPADEVIEQKLNELQKAISIAKEVK